MKLLKYVKTAHNFKNDPFGFIVDTIVRFVVNLIIPIPLAGELVAQFKGPVVAFLATLVVLGLFMVIVVGTVVFSPFLASQSFLQQITSVFSPASVHIPVDTSFVQTSVPMQIPFGGKGFEYASITAGFMSPAYFLMFGKNHPGIDLVPNETYYQNNSIYQQIKKIIVFATHTGTATFYIDENGGETVEVLNSTGDLKTMYIHFKEVYVKSGDIVQAGTPLGEMGKTGFATGEHVHYEIRTKSGNNWIPVDPMIYIK